ncbi:MAG: PTS sugar transporter subunit IIA, partial [Spirochaetaceae bacterium]|nr:PTS sugar transporter subunit IIA [Spirochaetaceae bacterium]
LKGTTKDACFEELVERISAARPDLDKEKMLAAVKDREAKMGTSVMAGIAVPHGYYRGFNGIVGAIGFSRGGIDYQAADNRPVHLVFLLVLGEEARERHLLVLGELLEFLESEGASRIRGARNPRDVLNTFRESPRRAQSRRLWRLPG